MAEYSQPDNDAVDFTLEDYSQPDNDAVDFSLEEDEEQPEAQRPRFTVDVDPLDFPTSLDLPLQPLNLRTMQTGLGIFLIGIIGTLGGASYVLRNYIAMAVLGLAVMSMLMSGTLGITLGIFWVLCIATVIVLTFGALLRVAQQ